MDATRPRHFLLGSSLGVLVGLTALHGCSELPPPCGVCGSLSTGSLSPTGDARLDGFFVALADLHTATVALSSELDANILALAEIYGVGAGVSVQVDAALVDAVIAAIQADFSSHLEGGVRVAYVPPRCSAAVDVAVTAQASCEANAGCECEAQVDPGEASVACEGTCRGGCSAACEGEISCQAPMGGFACSARCEGACELTTAAACEGTCRGECDSECSLTAADGTCEGECSGMCEGTCEVEGGAECSGTCHGTCRGSFDPGGCGGEVLCSGECSGQCSGQCEGSFTPPSASADCECEASAACNAQASAQAEAKLECTPSTFDLAVELQVGLDAGAEAAFLARLGELRVRGAAILQSFARAQALVTGEVDGEIVFDPSPLVRIQTQLEGLIAAGIGGDLQIPPGRLDCAIPAIEEAVGIIGEINTLNGSLSAHATFVAFLVDP